MRVVVIFGPLAVGKMTVGRALARMTRMTLFHNHVTIEPLLTLFPFTSPAFARLNTSFREQIFAEIAAAGGPGLIFTYVWALNHPDDTAEIERFLARFGTTPAETCFVELAASQTTRLARNGTAQRLEHKASKRDLAWSDANLKECDANWVLNTDAAHPFPFPDRHLRLENDELSPDEVARRILAHFVLPS